MDRRSPQPKGIFLNLSGRFSPINLLLGTNSTVKRFKQLEVAKFTIYKVLHNMENWGATENNFQADGLKWSSPSTAISAFWCERFWSALRSLCERGRRPVHRAAEAAWLSKIVLFTLCTELCAADQCWRDLEWTRCRLLCGGFFVRVWVVSL